MPNLIPTFSEFGDSHSPSQTAPPVFPHLLVQDTLKVLKVNAFIEIEYGNMVKQHIVLRAININVYIEVFQGLYAHLGVTFPYLIPVFRFTIQNMLICRGVDATSRLTEAHYHKDKPNHCDHKANRTHEIRVGHCIPFVKGSSIGRCRRANGRVQPHAERVGCNPLLGGYPHSCAFASAFSCRTKSPQAAMTPSEAYRFSLDPMAIWLLTL